MELVGGIHVVDGIRGANSYLVPAGDGFHVVDTGMPKNAQKILQYLRAMGREERDLRMILLTHSDMDHMGSAAELKRRTGAKIAIHQGDAPNLSGEREQKKVKGALGLLLRFFLKFMKIEKVAPDILLKGGEKIGALTVIATPGHTEGSVCFLSDASRTILVGDALRTTKAGDPVFPPKPMNLDPVKVWESAQKISMFTFEAMLPGHGKPLLHGAAERVRQLVQKKGTERSGRKDGSQ